MSMSAYSIMDSVNKYRHEVLIGNFVEDKFGKDLDAMGPVKDSIKLATTKDYHDIDHSLYKRNKFIDSQQPDNSQFYTTAKHFQNGNYKRPEEETTYNIFYRQEVNRRVPVLENRPKKEERLAKEEKLYDNTRYYLSNKFIRDDLVNEGDNMSPEQLSSEEIPDILTGQIWKGKNNAATGKPDSSRGNGGQNFGQTSGSLAGKGEGADKGLGSTKIGFKPIPKTVNPYATNSLIKPEIQRFQEVEYNKFVYPHEKGEHRDILFGHGIAIEQFHKRQMATTYDLSYNQKIKPQTQVNSFYNPDTTQTAKEFHRETIHEKNHQPNIPAFNEKVILKQEKAERPYQPYTRTFDANHMKSQYLRK